MILFDFFNVKNILLCIIFRPLWTSASRKITSTRPRSTFPEWRPSRRSKLTWPSGKMSAPPPNPSKWPQGSSIISALFFSRSDLEGAADAAIERRNEAEISAVLARCSASDRLLTDRLNRAKLSTAKKWAENRRVCVCVPVISARPTLTRYNWSRSRVKVKGQGWLREDEATPSTPSIRCYCQASFGFAHLIGFDIYPHDVGVELNHDSQPINAQSWVSNSRLAGWSGCRVFLFPLGPRKQMALARISQLYRDCDLSRLSVFFFSFLNIIWIIIHTYLLAIMRHDFWYQIYF